MLTLAVPSTTTDYKIPHEDVVLFALVHVANLNSVHPYAIVKGVARRPALAHWLAGNVASMHFSVMRELIIKLVNKYDVRFDNDGFVVGEGRYIRARGVAPPAILANPSAL
jgi:hypothetical protein